MRMNNYFTSGFISMLQQSVDRDAADEARLGGASSDTYCSLLPIGLEGALKVVQRGQKAYLLRRRLGQRGGWRIPHQAVR